MKKKKTEKTPSVKISKSQIRKIPKFVELYKIINTYSLREEAYAVALETYVHLKKKKKDA